VMRPAIDREYDQLLHRIQPRIRYEHRRKLGGRFPVPKESILESLVSLPALTERVCVVCNEGDFHGCHRHPLLTPLLIGMGHTVQQIRRDGRFESDFGPA
jgi:hypothetical protein